MAAITLNFDSFEEMKAFANELVGGTAKADVPVKAEPAPKTQITEQPVTQIQQPVPVQQSAPAQNTGAVPNPQSLQLPVSAITGRTEEQTQPTPTQQPVQAPVPTTQRAYTSDELAGAAMQLMDKGLQTQLQELLAGYGVEALPALPAEQFGNFATALRGLGAQI